MSFLAVAVQCMPERGPAVGAARCPERSLPLHNAACAASVDTRNASPPSLLPLPLPGLTLADKQAVNRALLASGATIGEMNVVRRHLSAIKGGRLAAACHPARVRTLLISDVPGDQPADIASGPTVPDASRCEDALGIVRRYGITLPDPVRAVLESGAGESIKPDDPRLAGNETRMIATPQMALEAAAAVARIQPASAPAGGGIRAVSG